MEEYKIAKVILLDKMSKKEVWEAEKEKFTREIKNKDFQIEQIKNNSNGSTTQQLKLKKMSEQNENLIKEKEQFSQKIQELEAELFQMREKAIQNEENLQISEKSGKSLEKNDTETLNQKIILLEKDKEKIETENNFLKSQISELRNNLTGQNMREIMPSANNNFDQNLQSDLIKIKAQYKDLESKFLLIKDENKRLVFFGTLYIIYFYRKSKMKL